MGIVRFALRFPHTFYVLAALILFLGIAAIRSMPTDIFPEIRIPVVTVIWQYTGLTTPEMEQRVSTYSQYSISANVNGIKNMEVQTLNGLSIQKLYFQPDVNLDLAIAQIVSATNSIRALMPPGIQPPIVVQFNASSVPVLPLSLNSDSLNEQELYDFGIYRVRQQGVFVFVAYAWIEQFGILGANGQFQIVLNGMEKDIVAQHMAFDRLQEGRPATF